MHNTTFRSESNRNKGTASGTRTLLTMPSYQVCCERHNTVRMIVVFNVTEIDYLHTGDINGMIPTFAKTRANSIVTRFAYIYQYDQDRLEVK